MPDLNSVANSPFAALVLALSIIAGFISGAIVSGRTYSELMASIKALTSAVETQNKLTDQALTSRHDRA